jgi:hypothetical protein
MVILLPVAVCVIGLIMYMIAANPKVAEVGRLMFWVGLLVVLMGSGGAVSSLRLGG